MNIILFSTIFISAVFSQGIYIDSEDLRTVYSLNIQMCSLDNYDEKDQHYMIGLSSLLKSKNQYEINFYKHENSKNIEAAYTYFIKPKFYLNMNFGFAYNYTFKNENPNNNIKDIYRTKFSIYGNSKTSRNKSSLKYYPIYTYEYVYRYENQKLEKFDMHKIGISILFNDVGIEPTYSLISKDVNEVSIKIYLWEFGD